MIDSFYFELDKKVDLIVLYQLLKMISRVDSFYRKHSMNADYQK